MSEQAGADASAPVTSRFEELARAALAEVTPAATVGALEREVDEGDGAWTLVFDAALSGYPGWQWSVSVAQLGDEQPTVLESELVAGEGALVAPEWVPWADRLEEYRASKADEGGDSDEEPDADADDDHDDDDDDDADPDDGDADDLGDDVYDGVDVDELLDSDDDESGDSDSDEGDDSDEDDADEGDSGDASDVASVGVGETEQAEGDSDDGRP